MLRSAALFVLLAAPARAGVVSARLRLYKAYGRVSRKLLKVDLLLNIGWKGIIDLLRANADIEGTGSLLIFS